MHVLGSYIYVEATYGRSGDVTHLFSPTFTMTSSMCLRFHYHMWGDHIGVIKIYIDVSLCRLKRLLYTLIII